MSKWTKEELEIMLEDVVNALDLSELAIEKHGPLGTPPAELVKLVLEEKNKTISMLKLGMKQIDVDKDEWNAGDKFTTPETGDKVFTVTRHNKYDVEAIDSRSRSGFTVFSKSYIKRVIVTK